MEEFDFGVFKVLASNDTGNAPGHQGGIVIPKDIAEYFPVLPNQTSGLNPTIDRRIDADLFSGVTFNSRVKTRYQYQTWGGTRSPERRLTDNLSPIRNLANADDIMVFEKSLTSPDRMRIRLIQIGTIEHTQITELAGNKRWGLLSKLEVPVTTKEILSITQEIESAPFSVFQLIDLNRPLIERRGLRLTRSAAFRKVVLDTYDRTCAFSGMTLKSDESLTNLDAAHIVAVQMGGTDDPRNGLALSKDLHWSFDVGIISVDPDRKIIVSPNLDARTLKLLEPFHGRPILEPKNTVLQAQDAAFSWHREHCFEKSIRLPV